MVNSIEKSIKDPSPRLRTVADTYDALFRNATEDQIAQLTKSSSPSISLYAKWLSRDLDSVAPYRSLSVVPGFLKLREGTQIPHRWLAWFTRLGYPESRRNKSILNDIGKSRQSASLQAQALDSLLELGCTGISKSEKPLFRIVPPPKDGYVSPWVYYTFSGRDGNYCQGEDSISVCRGTKFKKRMIGGFAELRISQNGEIARIVLDQALYEEFAAHHLALCVNGKHVFLAAFSLPSHKLYCADRQTGAVLWSRPIWGSTEREEEANPSGFTTKLRRRSVLCEENIVCTGNEVLLFGYDSPPHFYIESFAKETGEPLCKFSSRLWRTGGTP